MVDEHEDDRSIADHVCRFDFQPGWIDLTLDDGTHSEALGMAGAAMRRFNPLELTVKERDLLSDLVDRIRDLNSDQPTLASAFYTPSGVALADLRVDTYGEDETPRPSPAEAVPLLLDWSNAEVVGEPDVRNLGLGVGPAVRIQAVLKTKRLLGFGRQIGEFIKYAVFPPGVNYLIVIRVTWRSMQHSDEIVRLTDELVSTMQYIPVDADGNEVGHAG
jgi:hypothetical protein